MPQKLSVRSSVASNFRIQLLTKKLTKRLIELNYDAHIKVSYQDTYNQTTPEHNNHEITVLEHIICDLLKVLPQSSNIYGNSTKEFYKQLSQQSTKSKIQKNKSICEDDNDKCIIQALKKTVEMNCQLSEFSQMLYNINGIKIESNQSIGNSFSLQLYKKFRKIDESIHNILTLLHSYEFHFEDYKRERQILKKKEIKNYKRLQKKQNSLTNNSIISQKTSCVEEMEYSNLGKQKIDANSLSLGQCVSTLKPIQEETSVSNQDLRDLSETIQKLQNIIYLNNEDFRNEIYKYNRKIYDLETQLQYFNKHNQSIEALQELVNQLQKQIEQLQEQKFKDNVLINNMACKIRNYQKVINGSEIFLNNILTRSKHSRTNWKSADKFYREGQNELYHRKSLTTEINQYQMRAQLIKFKQNL